MKPERIQEKMKPERIQEKMDPEEIQKALESCPGWEVNKEGTALFRVYHFVEPSMIGHFVSMIIAAGVRQAFQPVIIINDEGVTVRIEDDEESSVSESDFALAQAFDLR